MNKNLKNRNLTLFCYFILGSYLNIPEKKNANLIRKSIIVKFWEKLRDQTEKKLKNGIRQKDDALVNSPTLYQLYFEF